VLWLFAIVLGIVFGRVTGGRLGNLDRLRFRWPVLVIAAVLAREVVLITPVSRVEGAQYIYLATLAGIVIWTIGNLERMPAMWLVTAGAATNLVVVAVNGGRMPVAQEFAAALIRHGGQIGQYTVMGSGTMLNFLADWIWLYPVPEAYSPGDVLIALGLAIGVFISTATPGRKVSDPP
jgi:hypothetical protein